MKSNIKKIILSIIIAVSILNSLCVQASSDTATLNELVDLGYYSASYYTDKDDYERCKDSGKKCGFKKANVVIDQVGIGLSVLGAVGSLIPTEF